MDYTMTVPCPDCPFRRKGGIRLTKKRIREIGGMMLDGQGGTFPCHRSVDYGKEQRNDGTRISGPDEVHCAGALAFALIQGRSTQMMRIAERLRIFKPNAVETAAGPLVWPSLKAWMLYGGLP